MKNVALVGILMCINLLFIKSAKAEPVAAAAEICNDAGVCEALAPEVVVYYLATEALVKELSSPQPFGSTNDIVRAIKELEKCLHEGMGPTNDVRKMLEDTGVDKFLKNLGIQLFS